MLPVRERLAPQKVPEYQPKHREYSKGTNLPEGCPITPEMIPKYCYYVKPTKTQGDGFCVGKLHPKQKALGKGDWNTVKTQKLTSEEKYYLMMKYLEEEGGGMSIEDKDESRKTTEMQEDC
jgi:hypothetical protein